MRKDLSKTNGTLKGKKNDLQAKSHEHKGDYYFYNYVKYIILQLFFIIIAYVKYVL